MRCLWCKPELLVRYISSNVCLMAVIMESDGNPRLRVLPRDSVPALESRTLRGATYDATQDLSGQRFS